MIWLFSFVIPALALLVCGKEIYRRSHGNLITLVLAYLPLSIIIGLRKDVGRDYYSYVNDYHNINEYGLIYVEPGFFILNRAAWLFDFGPTGVFIISAAFGLLVIWARVAKDSSNQFSSFVAMFGIGYIIFSLSAVRQSLAIAIFFFTAKYIWEGKFLKYFLGLLIGSLFHFSVLLMLPFYYILRKAHSKLTLALLLILSILAAIYPNLYSSPLSSLLSFDIFGSYSVYGARIQEIESGINTGAGLIIYIIIALLILYFDRSIKVDANSKGRVLSQAVYFGLCGYVFFSSVSDISRIFNYLTVLAILWHPNFISILLNRMDKLILNILLIFLWCALYLYPILFHPEILEPNDMAHFFS